MCTDNATTERALRCLTKVPTNMLVWNASTRRGTEAMSSKHKRGVWGAKHQSPSTCTSGLAAAAPSTYIE